MLKQLVKDALVSISLGFLLFIRVWNALLNPGYNQFFSDVVRSRSDHQAALINTLAISALLFVAGRAVRRRVREREVDLARLAMFLALIPLLDFLRRLGAHRFTSLQEVVRWEVLAASLLIFPLGYVLRRWVGKAVYIGALALAPFALMVLAHGSYWSLMGAVRAEAGEAVSFSDRTPSRHRVVWLLFDELDQRVAFEARPPGLELPALDRLKAESIVASAAYPPAGLTFLSIPSLLTGKIVDRAAVVNNRQLRLGFLGSTRPEVFPAKNTLFEELAVHGRRIAVFGWFFPYARMFPSGSNVHSRSFAFPQTQGYSGDTLTEAVMWQYVFAFAPPLLRTKFRAVFDNLHTATLEAVGTPSADLVFAHYSIPHFPGITNSGETDFRPTLSRDSNAYFGNLAFVDRVVADVVAELEQSGTAATTTIIVSSDHWWRSAPMYDARLDYRVPLLVRSPDKRPAQHQRTINTVILPELVKGLLDGSVAGGDGAKRFLEQKSFPRTYRYGGAGQMLP